MKNKQKLSPKYRIGLTICLLSIIFLSLGFALRLYLGEENTRNTNSLPLAEATGNEQLQSNNAKNINSTNLGEAAPQPNATANSLTVLLIGTDKRPTDKSIGNTDTLIVVHVNSNYGRTELLSVPRDTKVNLSEYGAQKINAIARLGKGPQAIKTALEELLGQPIDGYIQTNFAGFRDIINTLGGITVNVEKNMYYQTGDAEDGIINLRKGVQRLNGDQALQYARFRHDPFGDITRTQRQQTVLKAVAEEFMQLKTLPKLPWLIPQIYHMVNTDLPLNKIVFLANSAIHFNSNTIVSQTLPGDFDTENGISYWKVSLENSRLVTSQLFKEGKTTNVFTNTITETKVKAGDVQNSNIKKPDAQKIMPENNKDNITVNIN